MHRPDLRRLLIAPATSILLAVAGCSTAKVVSDTTQPRGQSTPPTVIYVADFEIRDSAVTSGSVLGNFPLHRWREESNARALAKTLADDVVEDLSKKGLSARRLSSADGRPDKGWLLRGEIEKMNEGDRLRRAVIGFGSGNTDLKVALDIEDLAKASSIGRLQTDAQSGKSPGAIVTLNPYGAAVKFVLSGRDLGENVRKTASQIADRVATSVHSAGPSGPRT